MALDTFAAGRYSGTYNAVDVGITRDGYVLDQESKGEVIDETDAYGGSAIEAIYRGGNVFLTFVSKAYKAGSKTPFWPWGNFGVMSTTAAPIGRLATDVAMSMVLTDTDNTPAATFPATLTAAEAILAPNSSASLLYNSKLREVPVRLQLFPYVSTNVVWWVET